MRRAFAALLLAAAALPLAPTSAAAVEGCGPRPDPRVSLSAQSYRVHRGETISLGGYLWFNDCLVPDETIGLFWRDRPGPFRYLRQTETGHGFAGAYGFKLHIDRSMDVMVVHSASSLYGRAVSPPIHITATNDPTSGGAALCEAGGSTLTGVQPPAGLTVTLRNVPSSVPSGGTLQAELVVRNTSRTKQTFSTFYDSAIALLVRGSNGEISRRSQQPTTPTFVTHELARNQEVVFPFSLLLRTCQPFFVGFPTAPGAHEVHAYLHVRSGNSFERWFAKPIWVTGVV